MTNLLTCASLFTGGGCADLGMIAAGFTHAWGLEYDAGIAEVANANIGGGVCCLNILDADPRNFDRVDYLHASPPCPNFSVAKRERGETANDLAMALKVAEFITVLRPRFFSLENVRGYGNSKSLAIIRDALDAVGYWHSTAVLCAADFGVPQTRRRLWLRAVLGGMVPQLPEPTPWIGWYAAIEDILDTLPESEFAPWQVKRLPEYLGGSFFVPQQGMHSDVLQVQEPAPTLSAQNSAGKYRAYLFDNGSESDVRKCVDPSFTITQQRYTMRALLVSAGMGSDLKTGKVSTIRNDSQPSVTVTTGDTDKRPLRAFLVDDPNNGAERANGERGITVRGDSEASFTISATQSKRSIRAGLLEHGRVVAMTTQALARFQSIPDSYVGATTRIIGNAVPPKQAQAVAEAFVRCINSL